MSTHCHSCGGPLADPNLEGSSDRFCRYCVDVKGALRPRDQVQHGIAQWLKGWQPGLTVCVRIARGAFGYAEKIGSPRLDEVPLVGLHGSNRPTEYRSEQHLLGTINFALRTAGICVPKARVPQVRGPHGFSHTLLTEKQALDRAAHYMRAMPAWAKE